MRAVMQRSQAASVVVEGRVVGAIERGLVAFVGAEAGDTEADAQRVAKKLVELRVFRDDAGKMSKSVGDVGGGLLLVSQFTLFGDVSRGNRPSFTRAMEPDAARALFDRFVAIVRELAAPRGIVVATGEFGADMRVAVENDGPVTIVLDTRVA